MEGNVGAAKINGKKKDHKVVLVQKTSKFVLAFETRRIRVKKDSYEEEDNNDFALLDDMVRKDELSADNLREYFNVDEVTTQVEDAE